MKGALLVTLALSLVPAAASAQEWAILTPLRAHHDTTWLEVHVMVSLDCGYTIKPCPLGIMGAEGIRDSCRHVHYSANSLEVDEVGGDEPPVYFDTRDTLVLSCNRIYSFETGYLMGTGGATCACEIFPPPPPPPPVWEVPYPPILYSPATPTLPASWGRLKALYR